MDSFQAGTLAYEVCRPKSHQPLYSYSDNDGCYQTSKRRNNNYVLVYL